MWQINHIHSHIRQLLFRFRPATVALPIIADKYSIELAKLSRDTVAACLVEKHVPEQQQVSIMQLLQDVDMARFAPGDAGAQMHNIYNEALNMIANM